MFLINTSFIMIYGLSGVYLKSVVGISTTWITLMEGGAEALSYAVKLFSGVISDYFKRRRGIILIGYGLMVLSKPIMAFGVSTGAGAIGVLMARMMERLGNGIQGTPRDAFVGDIAPQDRKGACYGLKRSLGQAGSVFGGVAGFLAMIYFANDIPSVFWLAVIPALCGFVLLVFMVKEPPQNLAQNKTGKPVRKLQFKDLKRLRPSYWILIFVAVVFMFARVNETLIAIHGHDNFEIDPKYIPLIMMLYNGTYCLIAYPIGKLSDRISRHMLLGIGMLSLVCADLCLGLATSKLMFFVGVALWGIQMGMTMSLFMALIADMTPKDLRGTSFGFFYLVTAFASLGTGLWAGTVAQHFGEGAAFLISACIATIAMGALYLLLPQLKKYRKSLER